MVFQVVDGVKGYSPLQLLPSFDVIRCVPVDYMHCVLLGVTKKLVMLWFNTKYSSKEWLEYHNYILLSVVANIIFLLLSVILYRYIGRSVHDVNARLERIRMPSRIARSPRSVTERSYWKGRVIYSNERFACAYLYFFSKRVKIFFGFLPSCGVI